MLEVLQGLGYASKAHIYLFYLQLVLLSIDFLTFLGPTPQNGQTHSNKLSAFCGVGA